MNEHILLVDDDLSILEGFEEILKKNNYSVTKATDEKEAVSRITDKPCSAAIIDIVLKESSGLDLINHIKNISEDTALIAITGFPSVETARESFKRGAFEYLEKPCPRDNLITTVKRAIERKKAEKDLIGLKRQKELLDNLLYLDNEELGARIRSVFSQMNIVIEGSDKFFSCPSEEAKSEYIHLVKIIALMAQNTLKKFIFHGLKILIIDNDLLSLSRLNNILTGLGCQVTLTNNSEEGKLKLKTALKPFDLIITEKDMFGLDGIELTEHIRTEISWQIPIIGISQVIDKETKELCLKTGMNYLLAKPIDSMELKLKMIDLIFNKKYTSLDSI